MDDLVSVIIATYNRPTLLKRALRSVEKQTHKNLEVIIIDDCSKFSLEHIISQFKSLNQKYKISIIDNYGFDGDLLEAQMFAYIGIRSLKKLNLSTPYTTGVKKNLTGGNVY